MHTLALVLFYAMNVGLVVLGAAGLLAPRWDIRNQLHVPTLDGIGGAEARRTLLIQYRYLKGFALALGIVGLLYRHEIFASRSVNAIYLTFLGLAAAGRLVGLVRDGRPNAMLAYAIIPFEVIVPVLLFFATRGALLNP